MSIPVQMGSRKPKSEMSRYNFIFFNKMRKQVLTTRIMMFIGMLNCFAFIESVNAQNSIPNGDFENWTLGNFATPLNYPFSSDKGCFFSNH